MSTDAPEDAWQRSARIQAEAAAMGFDWPEVGGVLDKLAEELEEIRGALAEKDAAQAKRELGDLLLASVNLARFLGADPTRALAEATLRFENRFAALRAELEKTGATIESCTPGALEGLWRQVKDQADKRLKQSP